MNPENSKGPDQGALLRSITDAEKTTGGHRRLHESDLFACDSEFCGCHHRPTARPLSQAEWDQLALKRLTDSLEYLRRHRHDRPDDVIEWLREVAVALLDIHIIEQRGAA